jgi:hypothetical protein
VTLGEDVDPGNASPFTLRGVDVNGGGKTPPFTPLLTLLFSGGSSNDAPHFSFFLLANCSSNTGSKLGSTDQKKPLPRSPAQRSIFLKARFDERLCRTEFYTVLGLNPWNLKSRHKDTPPTQILQCIDTNHNSQSSTRKCPAMWLFHRKPL